jgi:hypothetical protein
VRRKIVCPYRESNSGNPACTFSLYRLSYPDSPVIFYEDRRVSEVIAGSFLRDEFKDSGFIVRLRLSAGE